MGIRILNCAAMCPPLLRWRVGAPVLLIESDDGLVLVDSGLGLHDYASPSPMVRFFHAVLGIERRPELAAVHQVRQLGYTPAAVRHIVQTHLHFDHAGGLPDFPHARVHVHGREYRALLRGRSWRELAYDRRDFAHGPRWVLHEGPAVDWRGLAALRLPFRPEMYLVPLHGHTRGHCGVAVRDGEGWLLQCADALPIGARFDLTPEWLNRRVIGPHVPRLRDWAAGHPEVRLLAGHMRESYFSG